MHRDGARHSLARNLLRLVIYPHNPKRALLPTRRCVAVLRERGPVTVASSKGVTRLRDHTAFLEWLTSPSIARPASHVWLSPSSAGWDLLAGPLMAAGWEVRLSRRRGEYLGIWISKVGQSFGLDEHEKGRGWYGGSCLDLVQLERGLSAEDEARAALEQLAELDKLIANQWPDLTLDSSVASTAVQAFKRHLRSPIGLARAVAAELAELDAYGGGHVERYCARGRAFYASAGEDPWELDLTSAYPYAMAHVAIPGAFVEYGTEANALDPCVVTVALMTIPERLYPPLRYRFGSHLYYPWGPILGAWSGLELRAAEVAGCRIERVVRVLRFEDRSEEFGPFADALLSFRKNMPTEPTRAFAKGLGVQFVGALGSRVQGYRVATRPEQLSGCRLDRPGLLLEPVFEPSERQILSAALTITGAVSGWLGLVLRACELTRTPAYYIHTDGGGTIGDPRLPLDLIAALAEACPELHLPVGHRLMSTEGRGEPWKVEPLASVRCWAPNRRISHTLAGEERVAAGGISRSLTAAEILAEVKADRPMSWTHSHRRETGGWTEPLHVRELEPEVARELEAILAPGAPLRTVSDENSAAPDFALARSTGEDACSRIEAT